MKDYERDLLDNYRNPEPVPYTAEQLAEHIACGDNHHADYMWLLARAEKAEAEVAELQERNRKQAKIIKKQWIKHPEDAPIDEKFD